MQMKRTCAILLVALVGLSFVTGYAQSLDAYWVENLTSQAHLFVQVIHPQDWDGSMLPALVLVPGGAADSSRFVRSTARAPSQAQQIANAGFVVVVFDPDGRGRSGGVDDDDGYTQQDGLAAVIEFAARVGLVSYSYGVTMATGALARYPALPVLFYIDWEGPANRNDTGGCNEDNVGHLKSHSCNDEDYWQEREASTFALQLPVPYQRLQAAQDHVQPDTEHALLMIANATAEEYGGHGIAPWTRLNELLPNTVYDSAEPPAMPSKERTLEPLVIRYVLELFQLFAPAESVAAEDTEVSTSSDEAVLLFSIGMHIEPMGATVSEIALAAGATAKSGSDPRKPDYNKRVDFERHSQDILTIAQIVEDHNGMMTVQAQSPFTTSAAAFNSSILSDLETRGHEIALHFHEDAHLGRNPEALPIDVWATVMAEEIAYIHEAGVEGSIRYWSGGDGYHQRLEEPQHTKHRCPIGRCQPMAPCRWSERLRSNRFRHSRSCKGSDLLASRPSRHDGLLAQK
jgi:pimeloyl-ACP methyl ester carboxylesterase